MEHVTIWFSQVVGSAPGAGFQERSGGAGSRAGFFARDGAPVVGVSGEEAGPALDAFVSFAQLLHAHRAFTHDYVAGMNRVVRDLVLVQGRQQAAFSQDKDGAVWVSFT